MEYGNIYNIERDYGGQNVSKSWDQSQNRVNSELKFPNSKLGFQKLSNFSD